MNGHQNGHQTSQKGYKTVKVIQIDLPIKSAILASQLRDKSAIPTLASN